MIIDAADPFIQPDQSHFGEIGDGGSPDPEIQCFPLQPCAFAFGTCRLVHEVVDPFHDPGRSGFGVLGVDEADDPVEIQGIG